MHPSVTPFNHRLHTAVFCVVILGTFFLSPLAVTARPPIRLPETSCPAGDLQPFVYDRQTAASAAYSLSIRGPAHSPTIYSGFANNSAVFISAVLFAGGFPMVKGPNMENDPVNLPDGEATVNGWRAYMNPYGVVEGNYVWRFHDHPDAPGSFALVGYVTGRGAGGERVMHERFAPVTVAGQIVYPDRDGWRLNAPFLSVIRQVTGAAQGDYIWIDSAPSHGFIILGFGPAVRCNAEALAPGNIILQGEQVILSQVAGVDYIPESAETINGVPYVVDWGLQRDTARPFYCSMANDPRTGRAFNHTEWQFIHIPDTGSVRCEDYYQPNFVIDATGRAFPLEP